MLKPHLISTVNQKVLSLLVKFPDREFYEREVSRKLGISSGAANRALNRLFTSRVVKRRREGKMYFYSVDTSVTGIAEFKKIVNLLLLEPLVEELKEISTRVVLYGSSALGTDTSESDMDLLVVTSRKGDVSDIVTGFTFATGFEGIRIQLVTRTPVELLELGESEQPFMQEVERGTVLWERSAHESRV